MRLLVCQLILLPLVGGCAASLEGGSVEAVPKAGSMVNGIPYRVREQLVVEVYKLTEKGYVSVGSQTEMLADPTRLYVLNFEGKPLADSSLKIDQRADGTLTSVGLTGTGKGAEMATNAAAGIDSLVAAQKTLDEIEKTEAAAQEALDTKTRTEAQAGVEAQLAAVRSRDEAVGLELKLAEDRATLKASEIHAAESAIRLAKMQANTAAVAAGSEIPFPTLED